MKRRSADASGGAIDRGAGGLDAGAPADGVRVFARWGLLGGALATPPVAGDPGSGPRRLARPLTHRTLRGIYSGRIRISPRRFWARPSGVAFRRARSTFTPRR